MSVLIFFRKFASLTDCGDLRPFVGNVLKQTLLTENNNKQSS